ncbi:MAG: hypothetical protein JXR37_05105 [Kiritimatiellae bacterium]|nr:hypothetical protein [Kiritimatiellia bacterium]
MSRTTALPVDSMRDGLRHRTGTAARMLAAGLLIGVLLCGVRPVLAANPVAIVPEEYPGPVRNPHKGFQARASFPLGQKTSVNKNFHKLGSVLNIRDWCHWTSLETSEADTTQRIVDRINYLCADYETYNCSARFRVMTYNDWPPEPASEWVPGGLTVTDFTNQTARYRQRYVNLIRKVGEVLDGDPRIDVVEIGTGRWGECAVPAGLWRTRAFDDSGWQTGAAPFGYGPLAPFGTDLTGDMPGRCTCLFMRRAFVLQSPAQVQELCLDVEIEDGFVAWINGEECARFNVGAPHAPVACDDTAVDGLGPATNLTIALAGSALPELTAGTNILAVQAFNSRIDSSDFKIDLALSAPAGDTVANDADGDGLDDDWETAQYGDTGAGSADQDADGDGRSNFEEWVCGTGATDPGSLFTVAVAVESGRIVVSFPTLPVSGAGYEAGTQRHYQLQAASGGSLCPDWTPVPGYDAVLGTGQTVRYTNNAVSAAMQYRGRVWLQ